MDRRQEREAILSLKAPVKDKHSSGSDEELRENKLRDNVEFWNETKRPKRSGLPNRKKRLRGGFSYRALGLSDHSDHCFKVTDHYYENDKDQCEICDRKKSEPKNAEKSDNPKRSPKPANLYRNFKGGKSKVNMRDKLTQ